MIGAEERRRLVSRLGDEPVSPLGTVLKCAAGLLVLVVIAAGPWMFLSATGPTAASGDDAGKKASAAVSESRRVFEERQRAADTPGKGKSREPSGAAGRQIAIN